MLLSILSSYEKGVLLPLGKILNMSNLLQNDKLTSKDNFMLPPSPMNQCKLHFMLIGLQNLCPIKTLGFFFNLFVNVYTHTDNKTLFNSLLETNRCTRQSTSPRLSFGVFKNTSNQQCWVGYNQRATAWVWDLRQKTFKIYEITEYTVFK